MTPLEEDAEYLAGTIAEFGTKALLAKLKEMAPDIYMQLLIDVQDVTDEEIRGE